MISSEKPNIDTKIFVMPPNQEEMRRAVDINYSKDPITASILAYDLNASEQELLWQLVSPYDLNQAYGHGSKSYVMDVDGYARLIVASRSQIN